MKINIVTLFPEYFTPLMTTSVVGRAHSQDIVTTAIVNLRDFGLGTYKKVDDTPFGGGAGMVLMIEPIAKALESLNVKKGQPNSKIILTSAKGELFTQTTSRQLAELEALTFICGHYEGVDERVAKHLVDQELRIGNYVLSGGEPAVNVMIDSIVRLLPGTLGNQNSIVNESHDIPGILSAPDYTRPAEYEGWKVPDVLLGGNHAAIEQWKKEQKKA